MTDSAISVTALKRRIDCALGRTPCELCLHNTRWVDVFNGKIIEKADIFIDAGKIVDAGRHCKARALETIDVEGGLVAPGLIDAHVHIESSMLSPVQFARLVAPYGTTTIITDPHEIANVLGISGIRYMMREAKRSEITVRFMLPSCVPSTPYETSGATLKAQDLVDLMHEPEVLGLAELMNVPGLLAKDEDLLEKVALTLNAGKLIDGHSPLTTGAELSAYAACGVTSDHEASTFKETEDRLARGMKMFMREGSAAQNVDALSQTVTPLNSRFFSLCTDDASPDDVFANGHVNYVLKRAVSRGIDPIEALRMATINTALHFGLKTKGAVAPGYDADLVIFEDLENFKVKEVWIAGRRVAQNQRMLTPEPVTVADETVKGCVKIKPLSLESFKLTSRSGKARVIGLHAGDLINDHLLLEVNTRPDGSIDCDINPGLLKLAVIERHHATGRMGLALLKGFVAEGKELNGAIASTIAHDSHNIVIVGENDEDMLAAAQAIETMQGGLVLIRSGKVVQSLPLEIAGLMTNRPAQETAGKKRALIEAAHRDFHIPEGIHPIMTLGFLPLAVIPHLRLTDLGLFDVDRFCHVNIDPE